MRACVRVLAVEQKRKGRMSRNGTEQTLQVCWIANPRHGIQKTMIICKGNRIEAYKRPQNTNYQLSDQPGKGLDFSPQGGRLPGGSARVSCNSPSVFRLGKQSIIGYSNVSWGHLESTTDKNSPWPWCNYR
ncbi:hypothetical protein FKM82_017311 [Ascaphus truei]